MLLPIVIPSAIIPLESNHLKKDLNNLELDSYFDDVISKLNSKIEIAESLSEKNLLFNQINDLKILNKEFQKYLNTRMSRKTNKQLSDLFASIVGEIEQSKGLKNKIKKINKVFNLEEEEIEDSFDLFGYGMNLRDFVEDKIDFVGKLETIFEPDDINTFYHFFTIEYINFLNENPKLKEYHKNLKNNSGLMLNDDELNQLLIFTIKNISNKGIKIENKKIVLDIVLGNSKKQEKVKKDLSDIIECVIESNLNGTDCLEIFNSNYGIKPQNFNDNNFNDKYIKKGDLPNTVLENENVLVGDNNEFDEKILSNKELEEKMNLMVENYEKQIKELKEIIKKQDQIIKVYKKKTSKK